MSLIGRWLNVPQPASELRNRRQAGRLHSTRRRAGSRRARSLRTLRCESLERRELLAADGGETLVNVMTNDVQKLGEADRSVAIAPDGSYAVVWDTGVDSGPTAGVGNLYVRLFDANGSPRTGEIQVNQATTAQAKKRFNAEIAMDPAGRFVVAFAANGSSDSAGVYARRFDASGNPLGSEFLVNAPSSNAQGDAAVAMAPDGGFVISWSDDRIYKVFQQENVDVDIYAQRFSAAGAKIGKQFVPHSKSTLNQIRSQIAFDDAGNFAIGWVNSNDLTQVGGELNVQRYAATGSKVGNPLKPMPGDGNFEGVNLSMAYDGAGNLIVGWSEKLGDVKVQAYNSSGLPTGGTIVVDDPSHDASKYYAGPSIDVDQMGNFLVAWQTRTDGVPIAEVAARRYLAGGIPDAEGTFLVNTTVDGTQKRVSVALTPDGTHAVAVWNGNGAGDDLGVFMQRYTFAQSAPLIAAAAPAFIVTQSITTSQLQPIVAEAFHRWQALGVNTTALAGLNLQIADLGGSTLGLASDKTIWLDDNAAGWGWFVDPSPSDDSEFVLSGNQGEQGSIDLLSVVMHELGHLFGHDHNEDGVMAETLAAGVRRTGLGHDDVAPADQIFGQARDHRFDAWLGVWLSEQFDSMHVRAKRRR